MRFCVYCCGILRATPPPPFHPSPALLPPPSSSHHTSVNCFVILWAVGKVLCVRRAFPPCPTLPQQHHTLILLAAALRALPDTGVTPAAPPHLALFNVRALPLSSLFSSANSGSLGRTCRCTATTTDNARLGARLGILSHRATLLPFANDCAFWFGLLPEDSSGCSTAHTRCLGGTGTCAGGSDHLNVLLRHTSPVAHSAQQLISSNVGLLLLTVAV